MRTGVASAGALPEAVANLGHDPDGEPSVPSEQVQPVGADGLPTSPEDQGPMVRVVGMWRRAGAGLIDTLCVAPALLVACWIALRATGLTANTTPESLLEVVIQGGATLQSVVVLGVTIVFLYGFLFTVLTGRTPGQTAVRSRVIDVYGNRPEWWRAIIRGFCFILGLALFGLGLLWIGFDREKRGLHDWLAGTYVIGSRSLRPTN